MPSLSLRSVERGHLVSLFSRSNGYSAPPKGTPVSYLVECAQCAKVTELAREGRFCSTSCRARNHRETLVAQRERMAVAVDAALRSGDISALQPVAHAARLLAT